MINSCPAGLRVTVGETLFVLLCHLAAIEVRALARVSKVMMLERLRLSAHR
jgi:hypothetical protein